MGKKEKEAQLFQAFFNNDKEIYFSVPASIEYFTHTILGGALSFIQNKMSLFQAYTTIFGRWVELCFSSFNFPSHIMVYASV